MPKRSEFWVKAIYGMQQQKGLVEMRYQDWHLQVDVPTALKIAHDIIEAAEAATQDAFLFEWMQQQIGVDWRGAAKMLVEFRAWREQRGRDYGARCEHGYRTAGPMDDTEGSPGGSPAGD